MIREYTNNMSQETREHFEEVIPELATSSSTLERRAIDAERVVEAMKKSGIHGRVCWPRIRWYCRKCG